MLKRQNQKIQPSPWDIADNYHNPSDIQIFDIPHISKTPYLQQIPKKRKRIVNSTIYKIFHPKTLSYKTQALSNRTDLKLNRIDPMKDSQVAFQASRNCKIKTQMLNYSSNKKISFINASFSQKIKNKHINVKQIGRDDLDEVQRTRKNQFQAKMKLNTKKGELKPTHSRTTHTKGNKEKGLIKSYSLNTYHVNTHVEFKQYTIQQGREHNKPITRNCQSSNKNKSKRSKRTENHFFTDGNIFQTRQRIKDNKDDIRKFTRKKERKHYSICDEKWKYKYQNIFGIFTDFI